MSDARYWAVVPAAGIGKRMQADRPKQYLELGGRTVIEHTLQVLLAPERVAGAVVAIASDDPYWPRLDLSALAKPVLTAPGGAERCHSVLNALDLLREHLPPDIGVGVGVLVHDAARPCLRVSDIDRLIDLVGGQPDGGLLSLPVRDTMKRADAQGRVEETVERAGLWHALTPQLFGLTRLRMALADALAAGQLVTDEAAAMEAAGCRPLLVEGHAENLKITRPDDLELARQALVSQGRLG